MLQLSNQRQILRKVYSGLTINVLKKAVTEVSLKPNTFYIILVFGLLLVKCEATTMLFFLLFFTTVNSGGLKLVLKVFDLNVYTRVLFRKPYLINIIHQITFFFLDNVAMEVKYINLVIRVEFIGENVNHSSTLINLYNFHRC